MATRPCECRWFKKLCAKIDEYVQMGVRHHMNKWDLKDSFKYCPWCGKKLEDDNEWT